MRAFTFSGHAFSAEVSKLAAHAVPDQHIRSGSMPVHGPASPPFHSVHAANACGK